MKRTGVGNIRGGWRSAHEGSALTEVILISSFAALLLAAIPLIAGYGSARMEVTAAAKLNAWQRSVWFPDATETEAMSADQYKGASGSIRKSDAELVNDSRRHVFRDTKMDADESVHGEQVAEFTAGQVQMPKYNESLTVRTTAASLPSVAAFMDGVFSEIGKVQNLAKGESIAKFRFVTQGYFRTDVELVRGAGSVAERFPTEFGLKTSALHRNDVPLPLRLEIKDHVTMLSEPWSAGGTNREESKIQGLVPTKLLDRPEYQDFRAPLHQLSYTLKTIWPTFDHKSLTFGLQPGDAQEKSAPLDRYEWQQKIPADSAYNENPAEHDCGPLEKPGSKDCFRYYRSFPPPPVVNTLP
ncbi:hypothetical protein CLU86_4350 [Acidovorax sp. 62]|uniref:hypothetical protein n=1 Tax=Acidovorax sp. 62 TaxID=2035203 RepID=UPI000C1952D5|nr:hypothetical protein [Acidovorax sp. 62]PIF93390.1 hypothetical protein CLU86_4350 [Acidovorax sp. 62]